MNRPFEIREESQVRDLARTGSQGLALRSAALVRRGLRDLARDSNWLVRKVFTEPVSHAAVSPDGQVCTLSQQIRQGAQSLTLYDVERCVPTLTLGLSPQPNAASTNSPAKFAWSPDGRYLLGAWGTHAGTLEVFDLQAKVMAGSFGQFAAPPSDIAWSPNGTLVATACVGKAPSLELWRMHPQAASGNPIALPVQQLRTAEWIEERTMGAAAGQEGSLAGYGQLAFSPNAKSLAATVHINGEWADDLIVLLGTRTLRKKMLFEAQGAVTDMTWSNDGHRFVYCSAGQAYGVDPLSAECTSLPFGGEQCAWHPHLPICLFFSSWLRSSAKGRLFLADMNRITMFDECPAEGILDLSWSADGSKAYAVTNEGLAYIYEPELL